MKICYDIPLRNFEFWSGGKDNASRLTGAELDSLENFFDEASVNEIVTDTFINDMFWFEFPFLLEYIGLTESDLDFREEVQNA